MSTIRKILSHEQYGDLLTCSDLVTLGLPTSVTVTIEAGEVGVSEAVEEEAFAPGDRRLVLFDDGRWREAEVTPGFFWVDGDHALYVGNSVGRVLPPPALSPAGAQTLAEVACEGCGFTPSLSEGCACGPEETSPCSQCGRPVDGGDPGMCPACLHDARRSGWTGGEG
ncbi:hypothetical protein [Nocardioides sp.]|uniref:hypothetical protein n=1 Tax=Nocardioides sp. TaxID=35761 RepID=UPI00261ED0D3|nr:hypothetical protein [Nocardioides sp.]